MIELYHHATSTCSQKVRLALFWKKLDWVSRPVDLLAGEQLSPEYLAINPNGVVPTLVDGGEAIYDSSAITEYLDDAYPQAPLRPADPVARGQMRSWCRYIDEVPTVAIRVPSFNRFFARLFATMSDAERHAHAERTPLRKQFYRDLGRDGFSQDRSDDAMEKISSCLARMEAALAASDFIIGPEYSLADLSLTPSIVRLDDIGLASLWDGLSGVSAWYERIQALDNFAPAYAHPARALAAFGEQRSA